MIFSKIIKNKVYREAWRKADYEALNPVIGPPPSKTSQRIQVQIEQICRDTAIIHHLKHRIIYEIKRQRKLRNEANA